jgi:cytochrome b
MQTIRVWSLPLRALKWTLALSMMAAFATHELHAKWLGTPVHEWLGYVAVAAALLRVLLGLTAAAEPAGVWRFVGQGGFVRGPAATWAYACAVWAHREPRHLGHNPLGGWMIVALLADALVCGGSGWLSTTDRFWGVAWVGNVHDWSGHALLPLVALHVAGVVFTSLRQHENLLAAMIHGKKSENLVEPKSFQKK